MARHKVRQENDLFVCMNPYCEYLKWHDKPFIARVSGQVCGTCGNKLAFVEHDKSPFHNMDIDLKQFYADHVAAMNAEAPDRQKKVPVAERPWRKDLPRGKKTGW